MPDPSAVGRRVRELRLARDPKMSMRELASLAGISSTRVNDLEHGHQPNVTVETLRKLASALGVPVAWLLDGPPEESEKSA